MIQNFLSNAFYDRAVNVILWVLLTVLICWYNHYKVVAKPHSQATNHSGDTHHYLVIHTAHSSATNDSGHAMIV